MKSARHTRIYREREGVPSSATRRDPYVSSSSSSFVHLRSQREEGEAGGPEEPSLAFFCVDTCLALLAKKEREEGERHINRKKGGRGKRREGKHVV